MGKRVKLFSVTKSSGSTCLEVCAAIWEWELSWQKQVPRTGTQKVSMWLLLLHCSEVSAVHTPHCCRETGLDGLKSSPSVTQNKSFKLCLSSIVVTAMRIYQKAGICGKAKIWDPNKGIFSGMLFEPSLS